MDLLLDPQSITRTEPPDPPINVDVDWSTWPWALFSDPPPSSPGGDSPSSTTGSRAEAPSPHGYGSNGDMVELVEPVYTGSSVHNALTLYTQDRERCAWTGLCTLGDASVRISPADGDHSVDSWLAFVDSEASPLTIPSLSMSPPPPLSPLTDLSASPLLQLESSWSPITMSRDISEQDLTQPQLTTNYDWLGEVFAALPNPYLNTAEPDAASLLSCPSPSSSSSSLGPIRTPRSLIPPQYVTSFRMLKPTPPPLPTRAKKQPTINLCQCVKKTAKPPRHWRTSCPFNPDLEMVQCVQCGEVFRNRLDNYKRHLKRMHGAE